MTILISTHMLEMVKDLWDVMFVMEKGRIIGSYTRADARDTDIEELFFQVTGGHQEAGQPESSHPEAGQPESRRQEVPAAGESEKAGE